MRTMCILMRTALIAALLAVVGCAGPSMTSSESYPLFDIREFSGCTDDSIEQVSADLPAAVRSLPGKYSGKWHHVGADFNATVKQIRMTPNGLRAVVKYQYSDFTQANFGGEKGQCFTAMNARVSSDGTIRMTTRTQQVKFTLSGDTLLGEWQGQNTMPFSTTLTRVN